MSLIVLYFLHSTSVLSFYIDVVLTLTIHPVRCLQRSLNLTVSQRESGEQKSHLFLSFASPHHAVKTCSFARWLRIVMADAGIDMTNSKLIRLEQQLFQRYHFPAHQLWKLLISEIGAMPQLSLSFIRRKFRYCHLRVQCKILFWTHHSGKFFWRIYIC